MKGFRRRVLDPADRLGEVLFGLIMALGFTGAVRFGLEEADNRALFAGILGCNIAWGIVDGVMYALGELFERGRKTRLARQVREAPGEGAAVAAVAKELGGRDLVDLATDAERSELYRWVVRVLRRAAPERARLRTSDVVGALAVALVIVACTAPVVAPFLLIADPAVAVRAAHGVGLAELFVLGLWWGRMVGAGSWRTAAGLTLVGLLLVLVTIALGG